MKRIIMLLTAATLMFVSGPLTAHAKEEDLLTTDVILQEENGIDDAVSEAVNLHDFMEEEDKTEVTTGLSDFSGEDTEGLTVDGTTTPAADVGEITSIDMPAVTEYHIPFKRALTAVLAELPDTLTVHTADGAKKINVEWKCDGDYEEKLGKYPFVPDMDAFTLSEEVRLPRLIVTFGKEVADAPAELPDFPLPENEVPFAGFDDDGFSGATPLPERLNNFEEGVLPPVRFQANTGTSWAHATTGSIEADLIHDKKASTDIDLSEMHLAYHFFNNYKDPKKSRTDSVTKTGKKNYLKEEAHNEYAARLFSDLVGAVSESDAKFSTDPRSYKPGVKDVVSKDKAQVRNYYYINCNDDRSIKTAVRDHGGVAFAYYEGDEEKPGERFYNNTNSAYYCTKKEDVNHSAMIVGWDDNFSKDNFNDTPEGDGAWLVRNSLGDNDYSYFGYFWMSYYDKGFCGAGRPLVAYDVTDKLFKHCYAYDGCPLTEKYYKISPKDVLSVTYDVSASEEVKAVGVEVGTAKATINVTAKNLVTGEKVKGKVRTSLAGFYTIEFDKPLQVYMDNTVEVKIKARSGDGTGVGIVCEERGKHKYGSFTFNTVADRGFFFNGNEVKDNDLRVKLYTDDSDKKYKKVTGITLNKKKATIKDGRSLRLKATLKPQNATYKHIQWSSSNENVATVSEKGEVKALNPGKTVITARSSNKSRKAKCVVTVEKVMLEGISITAGVSVFKGSSITVKPVFKPENASDKKVTWKISDPKIATVSKSGVVTGRRVGKTKLRVITREGNRSASCNIIVKEPVKVKSVSLNKKTKTIKAGKSFKLEARIKPKNATEKSVVWKSSDKKVARVDKEGTVKGIKKGRAKITVTTKDGKKTAGCTITVK